MMKRRNLFGFAASNGPVSAGVASVFSASERKVAIR